MDNSLETKKAPPKKGADAPAKGKHKTILIDKKLKTQDLHHTPAERGKRDDNKTQPKPPDSRSPGASQAAGAAPTLRYGPAGDSAPGLRLKATGISERFPFGPSTRPPPPPFSLVNSASLQIGP